MIPKTFPRMAAPPAHVDALAWYPPGTPGLEKMQYSTRSECVDLTYPSKPGLVGVPRTLAPPPPTADHDGRAVGAFEFEADFLTPLRPEQGPFVEGVFSAMENELGCIGEAPTGFGKTTTGCALIARIGRPTCVVIPKGDLDWKPELLAHTTIPESKISVWQGQKLPDPDAWVVIAMLQSIYRAGIYPQEVYSRFACVIFDEVHRLGADEFGQAVRKFPAMFRLGLSATPDRRDGRMDYVRSHIGWRHVVGHSPAAAPDYYVIESSWQEPVGPDGKRQSYDPARTNWAKRSLMADPVRNAQIAAAAFRAHLKGRRTVVFVEQLKHADRLLAALSAAGVPARFLVNYHGGVNAADKERARACEAGVIIIGTLKYMAEGTNIPALDCAVLAHPIYDPRQPVGRILRQHPGKPKPVVIDVADLHSPTLKHIHAKRWGFLLNSGATWKGVFR